MSFVAYKWVRDCSKSRLGARLVAYCIADHADEQGQNAYPSIKTIMRQTKLSERGVYLGLKQLEEELGELKITPPSRSRKSNTYALVKMLATASNVLAAGVQSLQGGAANSAPVGCKVCRKEGANSAPDLKDFDLTHDLTHELQNPETERASKKNLLAPQAGELSDEQIFDEPAFQTLAAKTRVEPQRDLTAERNRQVKRLQEWKANRKGH